MDWKNTNIIAMENQPPPTIVSTNTKTKEKKNLEAQRIWVFNLGECHFFGQRMRGSRHAMLAYSEEKINGIFNREMCQQNVIFIPSYSLKHFSVSHLLLLCC